jgi:hypothetical protein
MFFVKLGGAAITDKGRLETLNAEVLAATASELAGALAADGGVCVVVHGCGSFGHQHARAARINEGGLTGSAAAKQLGFAKTRQAATKLNHLVVSAFIEGEHSGGVGEPEQRFCGRGGVMLSAGPPWCNLAAWSTGPRRLSLCRRVLLAAQPACRLLECLRLEHGRRLARRWCPMVCAPWPTRNARGCCRCCMGTACLTLCRGVVS